MTLSSVENSETKNGSRYGFHNEFRKDHYWILYYLIYICLICN